MARSQEASAMTRRTLGIGFGALAGGGVVSMSPIAWAQAQTESDRLVRAIVPYPAGSPIDVVGRVITPALAAALGQPVILDNRPGAGGVIGARAVMSAEPDGATLLLTDCINHLLAPTFNATLSYDPLKDFAPVASIARGDWVMVTDRATPVSTVAEFVTYAKSHPGKLNFGFGLATSPQVVGAFLTQATGLDIVNVPYKSGSEAVADMLGGRINLNFGTVAVLKPLISSGQLKPLAVTRRHAQPRSPRRSHDARSGAAGADVELLRRRFRAGRDAAPKRSSRVCTTASPKPSPAARCATPCCVLGFEPQPLTAALFAQALQERRREMDPAAKRLGVKI